MDTGLVVDLVVAQIATIFKLLACNDEVLQLRRDAPLLGLGLDVADGGTDVHIKGDARASQLSYRDLRIGTHAEHHTDCPVQRTRFYVSTTCAAHTRGATTLKLLVCNDGVLQGTDERKLDGER